MLKNRKVKLGIIAAFGWLLVVVAVWLFWMLPIVVRNAIAEKGTAALGKELSVRRVAMNPFRLAVTIEGIVISEPNGGNALIAVDEVYANSSVTSLWQDGIVIESVVVTEPHAWVERRANGSINLAEIGEGGEKKLEKAEVASEPMAVLVEALEIVRGAARVDDQMVNVRHVIRNLGLSLGRVSTRKDDTESAIVAAISVSGLNRAEITTVVKAKPFAETPEYDVAELSLSGCDITHYLPYVPLPPRLQIDSAVLNLSGLNVNARLPEGQEPEVTVSVDVELLAIKASESGAGKLLSLPRLGVTLAKSTPMAGDIHITKLEVEDPEVWVERNAEGVLNLVRATEVAAASNTASVAGVTDADTEMADEKGLDMRVRVDQLILKRLVAEVADDAAGAPFRTRLIPVSINLDAIDTAPGRNGALDLSGESADGEKFALKGSFSVNPVAFDVRFDGGPFPVRKYAPYYQDMAAIDVAGGAISVGVSAKMGPDPDSGITVSDGTVAVEGLKLVARDGGRLLADIASLNIEGFGASTKDRTAEIGFISLAGTRVNAMRLADERIDWQTLLPQDDSPSEKKDAVEPMEAATDAELSEGMPFVVRLAQVRIDDLSLGLADQAVSPSFATELVLNISASDISTVENARAKMKIQIKETDGFGVDLGGSFQLSPFAADISVSLADLRPKRYATYYQEMINFSVQRGVVAAGVSVSLPVEGAGFLVAKEGRLSVTNLGLGENQNATSFFTLGEFSVTGIGAELAKQKAQIGQVLLKDIDMRAVRMGNGDVDLLEWLTPKGDTPTVKNADITNNASSESEPVIDSKPWQASVGDVAFAGVRIGARDLMPATPVDIGLTIDGKVSGISTAKGAKPATLDLGVAFKTGGQLKLAGSFGVASTTASLKVAIDDLSIQPFEPYVRDQIDVLLKAGSVWTEGQLDVDAGGDTVALTWKGDSGIKQFAVIDPTNAEPLLKWDEFSVTGVDFQLDPMKVKLGEVALVRPYAGLSVDSEGVLNLQKLIAEDVGTAAVGNQKPSADSDAVSAPKSEADTLLPDVTIGAIRVEAGEFLFRDGMVSPAADHRLGDFSLDLGNVSLRDQGLADLKIKTTVGGYGNLELAGKVQPEPLIVDAKILLAGYQLPPLSPYSGRYIAREIGQGKLGLELGYEIHGSKVKATNMLKLDQLDLGKRVESKDAVKLPLGLAMSLLKDQNGLITIDIPVEGDLEDPDFRVGRVILQVLKNIIIKSAASPFKMLGSLGGSEKPLDEVPFVVGATDLEGEAVSRLEALAKALVKRPGLKMSVGGVATEADRESLKASAFDALLRGQKAQQLLAAGSGVISADDIVLKDEDRSALEAAVYAAAGLPELAALPEVPVVDPAVPATAEALAVAAEALAEQRAARDAEIHDAVLATVKIKDEDVLKLANERAEVVQGWLKGNGITDDRLFLGGADIVADDKPMVRFKPHE